MYARLSLSAAVRNRVTICRSGMLSFFRFPRFSETVRELCETASELAAPPRSYRLIVNALRRPGSATRPGFEIRWHSDVQAISVGITTNDHVAIIKVHWCDIAPRSVFSRSEVCPHSSKSALSRFSPLSGYADCLRPFHLLRERIQLSVCLHPS